MHTQEHGLRVIADNGEFPLLNRLVNSEMEFDLDELFEYGLRSGLPADAAVADGHIGRQLGQLGQFSTTHLEPFEAAD